jgi:AcrR family transcriptional regulator
MSRNTKPQILEAAAQVVLAHGVAGLTLQAVARTAGLSKGGLLYHYGSKEALLSAMVEPLVEVTEQRIAASREADAPPGAWLRGYLGACSIEELPESDPVGRLAVALLAAGALDPALLEPLRACQAVWREELLRDGIDPAMAWIVRLAADGLWMNDVFGLPVLTAEERRAVLERLVALTKAH